jgi:hypothetical protein
MTQRHQCIFEKNAAPLSISPRIFVILTYQRGMVPPSPTLADTGRVGVFQKHSDPNGVGWHDRKQVARLNSAVPQV